MSEFCPEQTDYAWEMTFLNSDPAIAELPPEPGWELCTDVEFASRMPEAFAQWEEHAENTRTKPDNYVKIGNAPGEEQTSSVASDTDNQADLIDELNEDDIVIAMQASRPNRRARRPKKRYEDMSPVRKAVHVAAIGTVVSTMVSPCVADVSTPELYSPPSVQYVDPNAKSCPPGTTIGGLNVNGFGDNMVGVFAARQEQGFLPEQKDICFAGLVFGTDFDTPGNASAMHEYIEKNKLKKVIIFAFSFGGMATIDMLNEYHQQHPDSDVEFSIVFVSAPADFDDLQDDQKGAVLAFSVGSLDTESVKWITYLSIIKQGDKDPMSKQVNDDTKVAAKDTPPRLIWQESLRILLGMSKSDMKVAAFGVFDYADQVVKMPQAIQSTIDRSGLSFIQVVSMTHKNKRMNNHAAAWWWEYNDDYKGPFTTVIEASRKEFERVDNDRSLALCTAMGKVFIRLAC